MNCEFNQAKKLQIIIKNNKSIELNELTCSLEALSSEYELFCKNEFAIEKSKRKLQIVELKKGSLILDLIPMSIDELVIGMSTTNIIIEFGKNLINSLHHFKKNQSLENLENKQNIECKNLKNISNLVNIVANDPESSLVININGNDNQVILSDEINSIEASSIQNNSHKCMDCLTTEDMLIKEKTAFYWDVASFNNSNKKNIDKAIIEAISKKPLQVIFKNENDKALMTKLESNAGKNWQDYTYIVDVEVIKRNEQFKGYKILHVYIEDTIID